MLRIGFTSWLMGFGGLIAILWVCLSLPGWDSIWVEWDRILSSCSLLLPDRKEFWCGCAVVGCWWGPWNTFSMMCHPSVLGLNTSCHWLQNRNEKIFSGSKVERSLKNIETSGEEINKLNLVSVWHVLN